MLSNLVVIAVYFLSKAIFVAGAIKDKPHSHHGLLEPYSGQPLPVQLTHDQRSKLEQGEPVRLNAT